VTDRMRTTLIGLAAAGCAILGLAGCGSASPITTNTTTAATSTAAASATPDVAQLAAAFAALNATANAALTAARNQIPAVPTTAQVRAAIGAGLAAYLAFDAGLQRLNLPTSMSADVTAQLHADSQVEADYQNVPSDASLSQMAMDLSTAHQDSTAAGAATITLRRDLGLPPTS
jgi:hypothetical protein